MLVQSALIFRSSLAGVAVVSVLATTACSGAPHGQDESASDAEATESSVPPANDGWSGRTNVEAVFEASCSGCHSSQWSTCWDVQQSAASVQNAISSGFMPRGGSLSPQDKSTVLTWLMQGAPCAGTAPPAPEGGAILVTAGEGAPAVSGF
jgi:hypothetical protein